MTPAGTIASMAEAIGLLQRDPADTGAISELLANVRLLRRQARGSARPELGELAAKLESVLRRIGQGAIAVDERTLEALSASVRVAAELAFRVADDIAAPAVGSVDVAVAGALGASPDDAAPPISVAIVGGGDVATEILSLLADEEHVSIEAVCAPSPAAPSVVLARSLGIPTTCDLFSLSDLSGISLVLDVSENAEARSRLEAGLPSQIQLADPAATHLLLRVLRDARSEREGRAQVAAATAERDRAQREAHRLKAGLDDLARANHTLNRELASTYFIHEFFTALSRSRDVRSVAAVAVDGAIGLLGAEVAALYVVDTEGTLVLRESQGRAERSFAPAVPLGASPFREALATPVLEALDVGALPSWVRESLSWQAALPLLGGGEVLGVLVLGGTIPRDITPADRERFGVVAEQCGLALENAVLHEELEMLAATDRMTGMYNHAHGVQRLEEEVKRAERFGHRLSLVMLDIDDFKSFNDSYGHPAGDEVLATVGEVVRNALRDLDVPIRYGGEEFAVILPETPVAGAALVAERIREDIEQLAFGTGTGSVRRTVSLGVAEYPAHATSGRALVEAADQALYRAKGAGKNRVETA